MSDRELQRVETLSCVVDGRLSATQAAAVLGLSRRQVHRLLQVYRSGGATALAHGLRGQPSNRALGRGLRELALGYVRERYADFGPTLAAEKLAQRHGLVVSRETLRQWMMAAGLWLSRAQRRRFHQPRLRREALGELVQIDGSDHRWFEDRGLPCTLLVFIDDATSRLMAMRFVASESTFTYFEVLQDYLARHGKPLAFYSDKHSIFRVAKQDARGGHGVTQFGRALSELGIEIICANSSQAKGRVERANRTLQDRLVKDLRLAGVSDMVAANAFLPGFMAAHNARFAREPLQARDQHRALTEPPARLRDILCWRDQRYIARDLTFRYERKRIMLVQTPVTSELAGRYVDTYAFADGRLEARWHGLPLPYTVFDKDQRVSQGAIVENKRLGPVLALVKAMQDERTPRPPAIGKQRTSYEPTGKRSPGRRSFVDKHLEAKAARQATAPAPSHPEP